MSCPLPVAVTLSRARGHTVVSFPHPCLGPTVSAMQTGAGNKPAAAGRLTRETERSLSVCPGPSFKDTPRHRQPQAAPVLRHGGGGGVEAAPRLTSPASPSAQSGNPPSPRRAHLRCPGTPAPRGLPGSGRSEPPRPRETLPGKPGSGRPLPMSRLRGSNRDTRVCREVTETTAPRAPPTPVTHAAPVVGAESWTRAPTDI